MDVLAGLVFQAASVPATTVRAAFWDFQRYVCTLLVITESSLSPSGITFVWLGAQDAHRQRIVNWINDARGNATAFDMTTKGILHAVFERGEFWRLRDAAGKPPGLMGWWPSRAVTFLENHDTVRLPSTRESCWLTRLLFRFCASHGRDPLFMK